MKYVSAKGIAACAVVLLVIGGGIALFAPSHSAPPAAPRVLVPPEPVPVHTIIGRTVQGRAIDAYTYGTGKTRIVFVGGMAGGYEWNSVLLAYRFLDYLNAHSRAIPSDLSVTVIPSLNADGVYAVTGKEGRFTKADVPTSTKILAAGRPNADGVDLNRNFDCNWKPTSMWQSKVVNAGTAPFSEPESAAIRDFTLAHTPAAFVFWHSQAGGVYGSECNNGILPQTLNIMNAYARASGYPAVNAFTAYSITGDSEGWLASVGIPAITVELTTHTDVEWDKNLAGIEALLTYYDSR